MVNFLPTKRHRIIAASILITIGFLAIQIGSFYFLRYPLIIGLAFFALLITLAALWEGLTRLKAGMLVILPSLFTFGFSAFYFLVPVRWLTRLPAAVFFGLAFYLLLLSQNVFNVASFRTIPLYRAASTVSFVFTILTSLLIFRVLYALHLPFYWNGLLVLAISFPLILQEFWSIQMEKLTVPIVVYSLVLGTVLGEVAMALSFWPIAPTILNMWSVALSTLLYILLGVTTEFFKDKLNRRVVWEYIGVGAIIFLATYLTTSWGG